MNYTHDNRHNLPSTLEPPTRPDEMMTDPIANNSATAFDRNSGKLPGLNSLDLYQQQEQNQEDYIRIKLSGMSVCVSPNSPRGGSSQERASFVNEFPPSSRYGPIRSLRRIVHPDQRRHSIANVDSAKPVNFYQERPPLPQQEQQLQQQQYHHHHHHHHNPHPGHYSAPSSPPLLNQKYSPYTRKKSISAHHLLDEEPPLLKTVMRRNSSAVMYRETDHSTSSTRRMSMNQSSRNNHIVKGFHDTTTEDHVKTEEEESESLYSRSPELRVSHKLAERKRRKEMKDLFDELKNTLPVDKSLKTSKWEILSKAVEYINLLRHKDYSMEQELLMLKHELESLKNGKSLYANN